MGPLLESAVATKTKEEKNQTIVKFVDISLVFFSINLYGLCILQIQNYNEDAVRASFLVTNNRWILPIVLSKDI